MFERQEIYDGRIEPNSDDSRLRLAELIGRNRRVLDVGCATGYLAEYLNKIRADCQVIGIEIDSKAASRAMIHCAEVICGDVENESTIARLKGPFDVIIFGDVLEHLRYPDRVLKRLKTFLEKDGRVIAALPNFVHFTIRKKALLGKFEYADWGILDRTHLRFFTLDSALKMFELCGYEVQHWEGYFTPIYGLDPMENMFLRWLVNRFPTVFAAKFIFVCHKKN